MPFVLKEYHKDVYACFEYEGIRFCLYVDAQKTLMDICEAIGDLSEVDEDVFAEEFIFNSCLKPQVMCKEDASGNRLSEDEIGVLSTVGRYYIAEQYLNATSWLYDCVGMRPYDFCEGDVFLEMKELFSKCQALHRDVRKQVLEMASEKTSQLTAMLAASEFSESLNSYALDKSGAFTNGAAASWLASSTNIEDFDSDFLKDAFESCSGLSSITMARNAEGLEGASISAVEMAGDFREDKEDETFILGRDPVYPDMGVHEEILQKQARREEREEGGYESQRAQVKLIKDLIVSVDKQREGQEKSGRKVFLLEVYLAVVGSMTLLFTLFEPKKVYDFLSELLEGFSGF